jgi:hypothetical protein
MFMSLAFQCADTKFYKGLHTYQTLDKKMTKRYQILMRSSPLKGPFVMPRRMHENATDLDLREGHFVRLRHELLF